MAALRARSGFWKGMRVQKKHKPAFKYFKQKVQLKEKNLIFEGIRRSLNTQKTVKTCTIMALDFMTPRSVDGRPLTR